MPVTITGGSITATASDVVASALTELNVLEPSNADMAWAVEKLQRIVDQQNAREELIYNVTFSTYTLIANHSPHTIGPSDLSPNFNTPNGQARPVKLVSASYILSGNVDVPITVEDDDWWAAQTLKSLTSTLSTHVYYSPDNPLGSLYFWPISTRADQVRLQMWGALTMPATKDTVLAMPPGYWDALVYSLAVALCPSFNREPTPTMLQLYRQSMKTAVGNNSEPPRIATDAAGMPSKRGQRPGFNFLTGQPW